MGKILLVVAVVAVIVYVGLRLLDRKRGRGRPVRRPSPPPRVSGPDDDEDFLREIERRRRREARERAAREAEEQERRGDEQRGDDRPE